MSTLYRPQIFAEYDSLVAAFSGKHPDQPLAGSIMARDDIPEIVANKQALAKKLGFKADHLALPHLEHGKQIYRLTGESYHTVIADGITTNQTGWLIGVAMADCAAVLIFDLEAKAIMALHSGWRSSLANITGAGIDFMKQFYKSRPKDLKVYVGPTACGKCYSVRQDVYVKFDPKYFTEQGPDQWGFDNLAVIHDQLLAAGASETKLEIDTRCTMEDPELFSARRDQLDTGRNVAVIGLR
jgi:YfiH family protein